ncbi:MAG: complex I subunit 5 family protein [Desulfurococcaceae archaeon]
MNELLFSMPIATLALLVASHRTPRFKYKALIKLSGYTVFSLFIALLYFLERIDDFSLVLGISFIPISLLVSLYTIPYMEKNKYPPRLEIAMDLFLSSIIFAYVAPSFLLMVIAWTAGEIVGYVLIRLGEEHSVEGSLTSSRGFIFTSTFTYEISVFTLITLSIIFTTTSIGLSELMKPFTYPTSIAIIPAVIIPPLIVGFVTKTANIPLHFWLPSAHSSAPSPASATLSGLMVSLGYYGLYRLVNLIEVDPYRVYITWFFILIGFLSILYGGLQALSERDVKKLLAYSTIATNGFVSAVFGLYVLQPLTINKWILAISILMHAAYKTTLFCEAGLVEIAHGTRYIHGVRGFIRISPISSIGSIAAILSLLGVPGTIGFIAKILAIYSSINAGEVDLLITTVSLLSILSYIIISALIGLKYIRIHYSDFSPKVEVLVSNLEREIQAPVLALGLLNTLLSFIVLAIGAYIYSYIIALITPLSVLITYIAYTNLRVQSRVWEHG